jgi:hypothetical protein
VTPNVNAGKGSDDDVAFVLTRRGLRRAVMIGLAVLAAGGIGVGAFLAGRSTAVPSHRAAAAHASHGHAPSKRHSLTTPTSAPKSVTTVPTTTPPLSTTTTTTTPTPQLFLGSFSAPHCSGCGQVEPTFISFEGDPTSDIMNVQWQNWGGSQATGTGTAVYVSPNESTTQGQDAQATVVAFDPGECAGIYAYQEVEWYFSQYGGTFDPSQAYSANDLC